MNFKKIVFAVSFLAIFGFMFSFSTPSVKAMTITELQALIQNLQQQIAQLQQQLTEAEGESAVWCHDFNTNLRYGDSGDEIDALWTALTKSGFSESLSYDHEGMGQPSRFGEYTAAAVVAFQEKYKSEILTPYYLKNGTGFVGKTTRAKLNELYRCETDSSETTKSITVISPNGGEEWIIGNTYNITWKSSFSSDDKVKIVLNTKDGSSVKIITQTADTGSYSWYIDDSGSASNALRAGDYKVEMCKGDICDSSDNYFSIVPETNCHISNLWDWNYCSAGCQCDAGQGDCDYDSDCNTGYCTQDVGLKYGQISSMDV